MSDLAQQLIAESKHTKAKFLMLADVGCMRFPLQPPLEMSALRL